MKLFILTIAILIPAVLLMAVKVLCVKNGRFPSGHIGDNEALRRRGIGCAHSRQSHNKA